jgi:hypothetical protein
VSIVAAVSTNDPHSRKPIGHGEISLDRSTNAQPYTTACTYPSVPLPFQNSWHEQHALAMSYRLILDHSPLFLERIDDPGSGPKMVLFESDEDSDDSIPFVLFRYQRSPDEYCVTDSD